MFDQILLIVSVTSLVMITPGPDMVLVLRNTLVGGPTRWFTHGDRYSSRESDPHHLLRTRRWVAHFAEHRGVLRAQVCECGLSDLPRNHDVSVECEGCRDEHGRAPAHGQNL